MTTKDDQNDPSSLAYANLQPEQIIAALEDLGYHCDGRFLALNSYENRVYQIGIEDDVPVVAKFYRPARWSDDEIRETLGTHANTPQAACRALVDRANANGGEDNITVIVMAGER